MTDEKLADDFINGLPTPPEVRVRLGEQLRRTELMRKLLRLVERREKLAKLAEKTIEDEGGTC